MTVEIIHKNEDGTLIVKIAVPGQLIIEGKTVAWRVVGKNCVRIEKHEGIFTDLIPYKEEAIRNLNSALNQRGMNFELNWKRDCPPE